MPDLSNFLSAEPDIGTQDSLEQELLNATSGLASRTKKSTALSSQSNQQVNALRDFLAGGPTTPAKRGPGLSAFLAGTADTPIAPTTEAPSSVSMLQSLGITLSPEETTWNNMRNKALEQPAINPNIPYYESSGLKGASQAAGGVVTGGLEWIGKFPFTLGSAAAAQIFDGMSSKEAIQFGQEFSDKIIQDIKSYMPESVQAYMGNPDDPRAKALLEGLGTVVDSTIGWAGRKVSDVVGGLMDYAGAVDPTGIAIPGFLDSAKPWLQYIAQFGTELASFGALGKVGKYVGSKIRKGEVPPTEATGDSIPTELAARVEADFNPHDAAERIVTEMRASETELADIKAGIAQNLRERSIDTGRERLNKWDTIYQQAIDLQDKGELLNTVKAEELRRQGLPDANIGQQILYDIAAKRQASAIQTRALESKDATATAELTHATDKAIAAINEGKLPEDIKGQAKDFVTGKEVPYPNRIAASTDAIKKATNGEGIFNVRAVPDTKTFMLETLEEPGRIISPVRNEAYSQRAGLRQKALLEDKGINTELIPGPGGEGFVLKVTSYTKDAAKARVAELHQMPEQPTGVVAKNIPVKEEIKLPEEMRPTSTDIGTKIGGIDIPVEKIERLDILVNAMKNTGIPVTAQRLAQQIGISREAATTYLKQREIYNLFGDEPLEMFAGIPISRKTAKRIDDMAMQAGRGVIAFLKGKGYEDKAAERIAAAVDRQIKASPSEQARKAVLDTPKSKKQLIDSIQQLAQGEGLMQIKVTKTGKTLRQISAEELIGQMQQGGYDLSIPASEVIKLMTDNSLLRKKRFDVTDTGFKDFVRDRVGQEWSDKMDYKDLQRVHNALLSERTVPGEFILRQKAGMPPITEAHLSLLGKLQGIKEQGLLEGSIWLSKRMDNVAPGFSDIFYWPMQKAWNRAGNRFLETKLEIAKLSKELSLSNKDFKAIGQHAIWQQPEGKLTMQSRGIKEVADLNSKQAQFYDYMRQKYESVFSDLNVARSKSGLDPILYVENYFTFFRELSEVAEGGHDYLRSSIKALDEQLTRARQTTFKEAKDRVLFSKLPIANNARSVMMKYMLDAYRHIELTPELAYARQIIDTKFNKEAAIKEHGPTAWPTSVANKGTFFLKADNFGMYTSLNNYINYVAGMPVKGSFPILNRFATAMTRNLAFSILSYNIGSVMRQFGTFRHSLFETSMRDMLVGSVKAAADFVVPAGEGTRFGEGRHFRGARATSDVLNTRSLDTTVEFIVQNLEGKRTTSSYIGFLQEKLGKAGIKPLQFTDEIAAVVTWYAAENKGKRQGLRGEELRRYADETVIKTQGSGSKIETPPIMRDPVWRAAMLFQTYVLNEWSFLAKNVLGYKTDMPTFTKVKNVIYYMVVTTAMSTIYEMMGLKSPFPTPLTTYNESMQKDPDSKGMAFLRTGMELAEPIPIIGGAIRYGSPLGGPVLGTAAQITAALHGDKMVPPVLVTAAKLVGVPGTNAFYNGYRTLAKMTDNNIAGRSGTRVAVSRPTVTRAARTSSSRSATR